MVYNKQDRTDYIAGGKSMIQLYTDILTGRITGYNLIEPKHIEKDMVFIDESELPKLSQFPQKNLYYVNGEITEEPEMMEDEFPSMEMEICAELAGASEKVSKESKILVDNIIAGMCIQEAASIAQSNREEMKAAEEKMLAFYKKHAEDTKKKALEIMESEERAMEWEHFLSMVAVVRDENEYLEEWIRYHIEEMGFDHFYLYDNESTVPAKDYLTEKHFKYLDMITFVDWPTSENTQQDSHNHFLHNYANETKWILPADPDEYIKLNTTTKSLKAFLEENSDCAAVGCPWVCFNANGHLEKTDEPDMIRFTQECEWEYGKNKEKYFAQSNRIDYFRNYVPIPRFELTTKNDFTSKELKDFYQLNHYYTRSLEEWKEKIKRGSCLPYFSRKYSEFFELNPDMADLYDGNDFKQEYCPTRENDDMELDN